MSLLSKMSLSVVTALAVIAITLPVHAATVPSSSSSQDWAAKDAIDTANKICASGNVAKALSDAPARPTMLAIALGEAARQVNAGQCKASINDIVAARDKLLQDNQGNAESLMASYNAQKDSGASGQGKGVKGFWVRYQDQLGYTLVATSAGEAVSPK